MFESLPCQSRVVRQSLSNLIQKFDSDAVLLPCFLVGHGSSTTSELDLKVAYYSFDGV